MVEAINESRPIFKPQERLEWYRVSHLLQTVGQTAAELSMGVVDLVHVGGSALFYRCYQVFGPETVFHFRGTHDLDAICFVPGAFRRILDYMVGSARSCVVGYGGLVSHSMEDKKSVSMTLARGNDPKLPSEFEADVFEPNKNGHVHYNNRILTRHQIVFDPPERLELPSHLGSVTTPSLRDTFILKTDTADPKFSRCGLREKDSLDILTILRISDETGIDFGHFVQSVIDDYRRQEAEVFAVCTDRKELQGKQWREVGEVRERLAQRLAKLHDVFVDPAPISSGFRSRHPLLPSRESVDNARGVVERVAKEAGMPLYQTIKAPDRQVLRY